MQDKEILDSLPMPIVAIAAQGGVLFLNRQMAATLQVRREEWIGRSLSEFSGLIGARLGDNAFASRLLSRQDSAQPAPLEVAWRTGDKVIHMREDIAPAMDSAGKVAGHVLAYNGIGREMAIDRMRTEFIAMAAHELRTPISAIKGSTDLMLSGATGPLSPEGQEMLQIAQKGCERLIRLINDVLDLSRIDAGRMKLRLVRMDLGEAAERCISALRGLATLSNLVLRLDCPAHLPLIEADRDRIEQVITNMLSNAIKYAPPNSEVVVEVSADDCWVHCAVLDRGRGIPESELERVFDKFHQVADERRTGGTGLGLAIARALIQEHKGKIWVESKVNEGSRFIFRVPVVAS